MPRPDPRTIATPEGRSKGGRVRAEKIREQREKARQLADERLSNMTTKALDRLEKLLDDDNAADADAYKAIKDVLDRQLGKPGQTVEVVGDQDNPVKVEVEHSVDDLAAVARILAGAGALPAAGGADPKTH